MGYTTEFEGRFVTDKPIPHPTIMTLQRLSETRHGDNLREFRGCPSFYCQWVPSANGKGVEWDGGEKFYGYVEWLQIIIDQHLTPAGVTLSGRVLYRGEDRSDVGYLVVEGGRVRREPLAVTVTR